MNRYIVHGGIMEYMAHLHCKATSAEEALSLWDAAFPTCSMETFVPTVVDLAERPDMEKHWKHDGYRYYCGAYRYPLW